MKKLPLLLVFTIFLILLPFIHAEIDVNYYSINQDFSLFTEQSAINICSCQEYTDAITIKNTGSKGDWYKVETNAVFMHISEPVIYLDAGASKTILFSINASCNLKKNIDWRITVTSASGKQKIIEKDLTIKQCQNLKASLIAYDAVINPCETAQYQLRVNNPAPFADEYGYSLNGKEERFTLASGETKDIELSYVPSCERYGEVPVSVKVFSVNNGFKATLTHTLNVTQKYDFSLSLPSSTQVCKGGYYTIPLAIHNLANVPNDYSLAATGKITLSQKEISLERKESKEVFIIPKTDKTGLYNISVLAKTKIGNTQSEVFGQIDVKNCVDILFTAEKKEGDFCSDITVYSLYLKNRGDLDRAIVLASDNDAVSFEEDEITLMPGEEKIIIATITNPRDDEGHTITMTATTADQVFTQAIAYESKSRYSCTDLALANVKINYQTPVKKISVKNIGFVYATYDLKSESDWISLEENTLDLSAGETKFLTLSFNQKDIPEGVYPFNMAFEADNGVTYEKTVLITLKDKSALTKFNEKVYAFFFYGTCNNVLFFLGLGLLIVLVALIFAKVTAPKYPYTLKNKFKVYYWLFLTLLILFLIISAATFRLAGFPVFPSHEQKTLDEDGITVLEWAEDRTFIMNISQYAFDPDMDILTFSVSPLEHITAEVQNGNVVFTPEPNWYGEEEVYFTAEDPFGETSDSDVLVLRVYEVKEWSLMDYFRQLCWTINLVVVLLIFTAFFFIFLVHNRRKKRK
ncbi:hypothetical protein C4573_00815 [Candidatus Woesearchaeota archaeon]|nr:MAG: hypothetical protein C4573_00815 [Candidatus Woesearchaeota archaeon]